MLPIFNAPNTNANIIIAIKPQHFCRQAATMYAGIKRAIHPNSASDAHASTFRFIPNPTSSITMILTSIIGTTNQICLLRVCRSNYCIYYFLTDRFKMCNECIWIITRNHIFFIPGVNQNSVVPICHIADKNTYIICTIPS